MRHHPEPIDHPTTSDERAGRVPDDPDRDVRPHGAAEVVRSEERLRVATETVAVGRARLVKYVVTEDLTYTVPVRREEVRLEFDELADDARVPTEGPLTADVVHEVVLHEEQVEVTTHAVPVERVRMVKTVRAVDELVSGTVRVERVEVDAAVGEPRRP